MWNMYRTTVDDLPPVDAEPNPPLPNPLPDAVFVLLDPKPPKPEPPPPKAMLVEEKITVTVRAQKCAGEVARLAPEERGGKFNVVHKYTTVLDAMDP
jgi:hypothetical protein